MTGVKTNPLKVLHIAAHYGGGVGSVVIDLAKELKHRYLVTNVLLAIDDPIHDPRSKLNDIGIYFESGLRSFNERLQRYIDTSDIILIHYWNHPLLTYFLATKQLPRDRVIFWFHVSGLHEPNIIPEFLLRSGIRCVFSTSASRSLLTKYQISSCDNFNFIHSTRDIAQFSKAFISRKKPGPTKRLAYVGTFSRQKMHEDSAIIFRELASHGICIDVVGEPSDPVLCSELSNIPGINVLGYQSDVLPILLSADCFLYPLNSCHYGTGEQVILEAMATGLPVICMNNPSEIRIVKNGYSGLVCSSPTELIARTLYMLSNDVDEICRMGRNAHSTVVNNFSVSRSASDFFDIFSRQQLNTSRACPETLLSLPGMDIPYAIMLTCSLFDKSAINAYSEGDICHSLRLARNSFGLLSKNSTIMGLPTKGSPFQYRKYFASSPGIENLCSIISN